MSEERTASGLIRAIGPVQLMLYGIGSMLGAGIYGLVGRAAGQLGGMVWAGFLVAMVAALLTGVSYASIASRYPRAAGAAYAAHRAFKSSLLSFVIGLAVICSGLSSMAAGSRVVAENVWKLIDPTSAGGAPMLSILAVAYMMVVAGIVFRGIRESLWFNAICTIVEAAGLILVIAVGMRFWGQTDLMQLPAGGDPASAATALLVMQGAVLTFFSFLGFEDMINVAEEVKKPRRTIPIAMVGAMLVTSVIYMAVAITAVSVVPFAELSTAPAPLGAVMERAAPWFPAVGFTLLTIFAVANTALVNYVMGSRLLYGLASQGLCPSPLARVHKTRGTPHFAILALLVIVVSLSFMGDISQLASATVLLLLAVFAVVNVALIVLKRREGNIEGAFNAPYIVPALAALICTVLIVVRVLQADDLRPVWISGGVLVGIVLLYLVTGKDRAKRVATFWERDAVTP